MESREDRRRDQFQRPARALFCFFLDFGPIRNSGASARHGGLNRYLSTIAGLPSPPPPAIYLIKWPRTCFGRENSAGWPHPPVPPRGFLSDRGKLQGISSDEPWIVGSSSEFPATSCESLEALANFQRSAVDREKL